MAGDEEPCGSRACADFCELEVAVGYLMQRRGLDAVRARAELLHLANAQRATLHQAARELLRR